MLAFRFPALFEYPSPMLFICALCAICPFENSYSLPPSVLPRLAFIVGFSKFHLSLLYTPSTLILDCMLFLNDMIAYNSKVAQIKRILTNEIESGKYEVTRFVSFFNALIS